MEALDSLERRIDTLSRMLGPVEEANITGGEVNRSANVVDTLLSTNSILNDALKEREQINKAITRTNELEKYLDPNFLEENQQVRSREVYLNAIAPDLKDQFQQLDLIKQLESTLGAEYFRNIPGECTEKLKQISQDNTEFAQQSELIEDSLISAMKRYGEIQTGLLESLDAMNRRLEVVEEKLLQKKRDDLEKTLENNAESK
ncbi:uncharacterized protein LOC119683795 [Teleopsis dalmanni]|uniref:uncharacterized protein LOC119683794 n=1 Tax=Teleopsis dalmanni TaxID=139649 RepID=UPI0018CE4D05|nr:uncharacterized protein LOC119683794 [Teleopsis dalmanni]XP_037953586.1 uncharacterized protein LOC119683795 [Teleopsis dalmanni]